MTITIYCVLICLFRYDWQLALMTMWTKILPETRLYGIGDC